MHLRTKAEEQTNNKNGYSNNPVGGSLFLDVGSLNTVWLKHATLVENVHPRHGRSCHLGWTHGGDQGAGRSAKGCCTCYY